MCVSAIFWFLWILGVYSEIGVWPIAYEQKAFGGPPVLRDMALNVALFV